MAPLRDGLYFLLFHGALLSIAIYLSYFSDPGSSLFSWHPFLMTLSMFYLMIEAVVMFSPFWSLLPKSFHRKLHLDLHAYLEVAVFFGFTLAFAAIYLNKEENGKPHFKSWHGFLGLIQAILIFCQVTGGTLAKYAHLLPIKLNAGLLKALHSLSGALILLLACANMVTSCFTNFYASQTPPALPYILSGLFLTIYGFTSLNVLKTNSRIPTLFSFKSK